MNIDGATLFFFWGFKFVFIVSAYEYFPPLNSFCTFIYCDLWPYVLWPLDFQIKKRMVSAETIWGNTVFFHKEFKFLVKSFHIQFLKQSIFEASEALYKVEETKK